MTGFDRHDLFKSTFPDPFWPSPFYVKSLDDIDSFMQLGFLRIETLFQRKNNTFFPVQLTGSIIPETETSSVEYIVLIEDISQKKKKEREFQLSQDMLITLNNKLENLVKKRTRQLRTVMKQKNEFINQLGHDLKNPLTPLMTFLPIIYDKVPDKKSKDIVTRLNRNVEFMKDLIVNTVELAKLDSVDIPFSYESINLQEEINTIIQANFSLSNNKNIQITNKVDDNVIFEVDKIRFKELIINLLTNAMKYGKENGLITIFGNKSNNEMVEMKIIDDGIGMNPNQVENVFKEFYRVNQNKSTFKSTGLGMAICKRIVERHGGTIYCESEGIGKGTTFCCYFPINHDPLKSGEINNTHTENLRYCSK